MNMAGNRDAIAPPVRGADTISVSNPFPRNGVYRNSGWDRNAEGQQRSCALRWRMDPGAITERRLVDLLP